MRTLFLVCYDIAEPKRLHKVHKYVNAFAIGGQKSFYECWLTRKELFDMKKWFETELNLETDRVHFFQLDNRQEVLYLGVAKATFHHPFLMI